MFLWVGVESRQRCLEFCGVLAVTRAGVVCLPWYKVLKGSQIGLRQCLSGMAFILDGEAERNEQSERERQRKRG